MEIHVCLLRRNSVIIYELVRRLNNRKCSVKIRAIDLLEMRSLCHSINWQLTSCTYSMYDTIDNKWNPIIVFDVWKYFFPIDDCQRSLTGLLPAQQCYFTHFPEQIRIYWHKMWLHLFKLDIPTYHSFVISWLVLWRC